MPKPKEITFAKQLLVEGRDAEAFFYPFLESLHITGVQIQDFGGITELAAFLRQFVLSQQYRLLPVTSIGIVRDAEQNDHHGKTYARSVCAAVHTESSLIQLSRGHHTGAADPQPRVRHKEHGIGHPPDQHDPPRLHPQHHQHGNVPDGTVDRVMGRRP